MTTNHDLERALHSLRRPAPESVLEGSIYEIGLSDRFAEFDGPLGPVAVAWNGRGVTACVPTEVLGDRNFAEIHPREATPAPDVPEWIGTPLSEALATGRLGRLPIDLSALGEFQRKVLEKCAEIPPGEIRPYGWIAEEIGKPGAVRAVGTALAHNPVPILIPCHRVVRSDGKIGNYAYGSPMKRALLESEGLDPDGIEAEAGSGTRFVGSDTTGIYCYPTCRNARRITAVHRVRFRSGSQATDTGYRACRVCRPAA